MNTTHNITQNASTSGGVSMESIIDPDADPVFGFWLNGVGIIFIGVMGIFGNIASIRVLSHKQMRSSVNFILIALSSSDIILILTAILLFGFTTFYPYNGGLKDFYYIVHPIIAEVAYPVAMITQTISIYLTCLISFERYIAVCHPLKASRFCTHTRTKIFIFSVVFFSIVYNLPKFFEIRLLEAHDEDYGKFYFISASKLRVNKTYISIYIHWFYCIFMNLIPLSGITFFNLMIYWQVRIVNKMRVQLTCKNYEQDIKLTSMLFCVVIVFLSCNFLAVLTNVLETFYHIHNDSLTKLSNFFVTFNSSVNFIIYVVLVKKFRIIFIRQLRDFFSIQKRRYSNAGGSVNRTSSDSDPATKEVLIK